MSTWAAFQHIRSALSSKELKTRQTDKLSNIALLIAMLYAVLAFMFPDRSLQIFWPVDALFGVFFLSYATLRLGIITTLNDRQAVLVFELLVCMILVGMFIAVNIGAFYIWMHLRH